MHVLTETPRLHPQDALNAAHARPEELKRKMERVAGRDGDSSSSSDEEDGAGVQKYANQARALLDESDSDAGAGGDGEGATKPKGLFGLKFMQDVAQRRREEARKETAALVSELEALGGDGSDSKAAGDEAGAGGGMATGRRTFSGAQVGTGASKGGQAQESAAEARAADEAMRAALRSGSGGRGAGLQVAEVRCVKWRHARPRGRVGA